MTGLALALLLTTAPHPDPVARSLAESSIRVWLCPDHPEIHHDRPDRCDACGRAFEERSVTWRWSCLMHPEQASDEPGACPVCGMKRVVTTVEVVWRCLDDPRDLRTAPGSCRGSGVPLEPELRAMAHGDHNPRHGGQFFMSSDRFHHLEGTLRDGRFRLFLYDDFTRPLPASAAVARVGDTPLAADADGTALEARVATSLPAEIVVHVDFGEGEQRYDFTFEEESLPPSSQRR